MFTYYPDGGLSRVEGAGELLVAVFVCCLNPPCTEPRAPGLSLSLWAGLTLM